MSRRACEPPRFPAHAGLRLMSSRRMARRLLIWGDVVHARPYKLPRPILGIVYDIDGRRPLRTLGSIVRQPRARPADRRRTFAVSSSGAVAEGRRRLGPRSLSSTGIFAMHHIITSGPAFRCCKAPVFPRSTVNTSSRPSECQSMPSGMKRLTALIPSTTNRAGRSSEHDESRIRCSAPGVQDGPLQ